MQKKITCFVICMLMITSSIMFVSAASEKNKKESTSTSAPSDFELLATAGGIAPWESKSKLEINSDGEAKYYSMDPIESGTWNLVDEFTLTSTQLDEIWDELIANDFFNMDDNYEDTKWKGGSYAELTVTGDGETKTVRTQNIIIKAFNAIMDVINTYIPGDNGLYYNALTDEKLNQAPGTPDKPTGKTNGKAGTEYTYETTGTEPEYDDMYYWFNWGDGANSGWLGPYKPGDTVQAKHIWNSQGNYNIKVKAKDYLDAESGWSQSLGVSMPKAKTVDYSMFNFLFKFLGRFWILRNLFALPETYTVSSEPTTVKATYEHVETTPVFEVDTESELPLYVAAEDTGSNTTVKLSGCKITVYIHIEIFGKGASQAIANKIESGIEKVWNKDPATGKDWVIICKEKNKNCPKTDPGCTVTFDAIVKLQKNGKPTKGYHQVEIKDHNDYPNGFHRSTATMIPPDGQHQGEGEWDTGDTEEVFAHEAGHLMGLDDYYDPETGKPLPGYENNIMGTTKKGAKPSKAQVEKIVHDGGVYCPCSCCPEKPDKEKPKNKITKPQNGEPVQSSKQFHIEGEATDYGGSGVYKIHSMFEWSGGDYTSSPLIIDPPQEYVQYQSALITLDQFMDPEDEDWFRITTYATDYADNVGEDTITIYRVTEEDNTPPVTEKNIEDQYYINAFTPITLEATDDMSGVQFIHYEIWQEGIQMADETISDDSATFATADYGIYYGLIQLKFYAVDNAQNQEAIHVQEHFVEEGPR